jgi:phosphoribosyl-AMP cyclohydrolase
MSEILSNPVPVDSLAWEKMNGKIPTIVKGLPLKKESEPYRPNDVVAFLAEATEDDVRKVLRGENPWGKIPVEPAFTTLMEIEGDRTLADCDGDAVLVYAHPTVSCDRLYGSPSVFYRRINGIEDLDDITWGENGLSAAVIVGTDSTVLGLAYTNREAAGRNFDWVRIEGAKGSRAAVPAEKNDPQAKRLMTLWSRRRGLWIKGLNSGQFMEFQGMARTGEQYRDKFGKDALLYVVAHAPGAGFCHEKYSDMGIEGEGYIRSCFHRRVSL